ncbi:amino acid transporter [Desulfolithobacter dissulfuricans]|uniref:Amino acid transporter n=1 Tax=Desulfolithobacter dissulfuricans TaxID=2795293 RepID=A0A915U6S0_9BACT|nr:LysE family translocator [Desulfolithobacter dissulfuricans]BCO10507.1 amino acid transporter [Desulfolithobacter dissulfuricans]
MENWPIFVATVTLLVLTPGPSVLLALSHGIRYGRLKALQTIAGNVSANSIQILLASLGLGLLLKNAPLLFHAVKWVGVGYILLLAIRLWKQDTPLKLRQEDRHDTALARYRQGFLTSFTNPKAIIFFSVLFPIFLDDHHNTTAQCLLLGTTFMVLNGTALFLYACLGEWLADLLQDTRFRLIQGRVTALLLTIGACLLALVQET